MLSSFDIPLSDNVMVLHFDQLPLRSQVGVLVVGYCCGDGMGEGGRGDLDG
jgi:hypothetical protein